MSKLFYDHLIEFEEVETKISTLEIEKDKKEEIRQTIEETIHYRVMTRILTHLPREHHNEFLEKFYRAPHHAGLLKLLKDKVENIEEEIKDELSKLKKEILKDLDS